MNSPLCSHWPHLRSLSSGPSPVASRQSKEGRFHSLRSAALWASLHGLALAITLCSGSLALAQGVTIPHEFTNGEVADATQVNDNFSALADALGVTAPNSFANSGIIGMDEVNANFQSLKLAVDTFTTDLAAATAATETAAENTCNQVGGTWDAGTSTCTPAAAPYNCFIGGFCSRAVIAYSSAYNGYTNVYDGHTQTTEPAIGAGCSVAPGNDQWYVGKNLVDEYVYYSSVLVYADIPRPDGQPGFVRVWNGTSESFDPLCASN